MRTNGRAAHAERIKNDNRRSFVVRHARRTRRRRVAAQRPDSYPKQIGSTEKYENND